MRVQMTTMRRMVVRRRKVGVALGAGGARGLAHIGVLRGLAEAGIPPDAVVGTSSGALIGAIYAAGQIENYERQMRELEWSDVIALLDPVWPRSGLVSGTRALDRLAGPLREWRIEDLALPFAAVSVDLVSGEEVLIREGRVIDAVRASISIPGIFVPRRSGRRLLVDGALRNPVPVSALDEFDVDVRVGVNLYHDPVRELAGAGRGTRRAGVAARLSDALEARLARFRRRGRPPATDVNGVAEGLPNLFEIMTASLSLVEYELARHRLARDAVDVVIEPAVRGIRTFDFHKAQQAIPAGRHAVEAALPELERALRRRGRTRRRRRA